MGQHFEIFALEHQFTIDLNVLEQRYKSLLADNHPDKVASYSAFEQKQAMMMAAAINDAYRVLSNPLNRAAYLLESEGINADDPLQTSFPEGFLLQQMQWREDLEEVSESRSESNLKTLFQEVQAAYQQTIEQLSRAFDEKEYLQAANYIRQGRFLEKLLTEIDDVCLF